MRSADIVNQLSAKLPALVDDFTNSIAVTSLTRSGTTVTVNTAAAHGLKVNDSVNITGAQTPIVISSITRVGIAATLVTATDHDATKDVPKLVEITGATEPEFNGTFPVLQVTNRRTIVFQVPDSGPTTATGSPLLLNASNVFQSYNGLKGVTTVPSNTAFTYEIANTTLFTPAAGTIIVKAEPRISAAASVERATASYTKQLQGNAWLFVVLNDTVANKDRSLNIDGTADIQRPQFFKQYNSQTVSLFVFLPSSSFIGGRQARDRAEELWQPICQSVLFKKFDSLLATGEYNALMFNEHGVEGYDSHNGFYIHRYTFEMNLLLSFSDTVGYDEDVAFRDIDMTQAHDIGTGVIESEINLDDEPLP